MASQSVPLSTLAGKGAPLEWRDAVALVAQLIRQVRADIPFAQGRVPSLAGIALEPDGTLVLTTDPKQSSPGMPGAAQILQQLLSAIDSPSELRLVTMQAVKAESPPSLDGFAEELAKWEGFDRQV